MIQSAARAPRRRSTSSSASAQGKFPKAIPDSRARRPTATPGRRPSRRRRQYNEPGPLHRLHRLRVDLEHRRQQPAPQRHLPRQRRQGRAWSSRSPRCRRSAATTRATCGSGWRPTRRRPAASVLAIAHNGNLSNGRMFPMVESFGKTIDREYAETRAKWERLYEATQIKGDGETHPVPVAQRRVRQLRALGQGQPRRQRGARRRRCSSSSTRARR